MEEPEQLKKPGKRSSRLEMFQDQPAYRPEMTNRQVRLKDLDFFQLLPEHGSDPEVQAKIVEARCQDEIYQTSFTSYVPIGKLSTEVHQGNLQFFPDTVLNPKTRITAEAASFHWLDKNHKLKKRNMNDRRKERGREVKRFNFLKNNEIHSVFCLYQAGQDFIKAMKEQKNAAKLNYSQWSLSPFNLELARRGYEHALWKYYLLDVFHPLNSLEIKNTPQDLKLYKQLKGKIITKKEKPLPPADIPPGTMIATQKKPPNVPKKTSSNPEDWLLPDPNTEYVLVPLKNLKALSYQHKITAEEIFDPKRKLGFLQCFAKKHNEVIQKLVRPFNQPEPPLPLEEPMDAATEGEPLPLEELIDAATEVVDTTYQEELMEASNPPPDDSDRPISPVPSCSQEDPLGLNTLPIPRSAFDIEPDDLTDARHQINAIKRKKELASKRNGTEDQSSKKQRTEYPPFQFTFDRPKRACESGPNVPKVTKPKLASTSVGLAVYGAEAPGPIPLKKNEACPKVKQVGLALKNIGSGLKMTCKGREVHPSDDKVPDDHFAFSIDFKMDTQNSPDHDCPVSCPIDFLTKLKPEECCDSSAPNIDGMETFSELVKRRNQTPKEGPYQMDFGDNNTAVPGDMSLILASNRENKVLSDPDLEQKYCTSKDEAYKLLNKAGFFDSIYRERRVALDVEGCSAKYELEHDIQANCGVSIVHVASPSGFTFDIQCNWDQKEFKGHKVPGYILQILSDPTIIKQGSGISEDLLKMNRMFPTLDFKGSLENHRLLYFLDPSIAIEQEHPTFGKRFVSKYLGYGYFIFNKKRINPSWHGPHCWNFTKNPKSWTNAMHQYQRLDKLLSFDLFDRCVEKLCIFYGFKDSPEANIGFIKYALMGLLMDQGKMQTPYDVKFARIIIPPCDMFEKDGYNPFGMELPGFYPSPRIIAAQIQLLLQGKRIYCTPLLANLSMQDLNLGPTDLVLATARGLQSITTLHGCQICGEGGHDASKCKGNADTMDNDDEEIYCEYPFCDSMDHTIKNCSVLVNRCLKCRVIGHLSSRHDDPKFDIVRGMVVSRAYAHKHQFANLMNTKEVIFTCTTRGCTIRTAHPKTKTDADLPDIIITKEKN